MPFYKGKGKAILVLSVVSIISCTARPPIFQTPVVEPELTLTQKLQNTLDSTRKASNLKGVSVAIIRPNGEIWLGVSCQRANYSQNAF